VTISTDISSLLGNGPESGDGKLLDVLRTISKHLEGGSPEDVEALESTDLKGLDQNYETLISLETKSGTAIDQFQSAIGGIESLQSTITAALSNTDSANIATTSIDFSNQQAAYTAALRAGATIVQESLLNFLQ
jgi:flagellar hook-associated protein 3 FlgL